MKLLTDAKGRSYLVSEGKDLHCNWGVVKAQDIDKAKAGEIVESNKAMKFHVLNPDILDYIKKARRGPQAVTLKDMGLITAYAGIHSGSKVVEAGTGSGLLSMYLAHTINPGKLVTYELREDFRAIAIENFERFGFKNIESKLQNIYDGVDEKELDAIILDLPEPWDVIPHAQKALKVGGRIVSYSPSVNQVNKFSTALPEIFSQETFECIQRHWKPDTMRPDTQMIGHTGFLTVARKLE
ncbi:MAG TPA: tRNA (adenine-N1)-methyltransferase [Candidatus Altiarchaeales archaeon]|nr:tRNA (adenine-N1)-methyltransferase [Candidatus Altiarchaeales archaeon]